MIAAAAAWLAVAVAKQPRAANRLPHLAANRLRPANLIPAIVVDVKVYSLASKPVGIAANQLPLAVVAFQVAPLLKVHPKKLLAKKLLAKKLKVPPKALLKLALLKHRFAP